MVKSGPCAATRPKNATKEIAGRDSLRIPSISGCECKPARSVSAIARNIWRRGRSHQEDNEREHEKQTRAGLSACVSHGSGSLSSEERDSAASGGHDPPVAADDSASVDRRYEQ